VADDFNAARRAGERQCHIDRDGHPAPDIDVTLEWHETLRLHRHVIGIGRQVAERELPAGVGRRRPCEAGDEIADGDVDGLHHAACRILHRSLHGASATQTLCDGLNGTAAAEGDRDAEGHRMNLLITPTRHRTSPSKRLRNRNAR
jgi:hypothetical protein